MNEGDIFAEAIFSNLVGIMGFLGLVLLIISPLYIFKTFRSKRGNMGKPVICLIFGLMFFLTWIFEGYV